MAEDISKKVTENEPESPKGFITTTIFPESPQTQNTFSTTRQGTATNQFTKVKTNKINTQIDPITGTANLTSGDFIVTMPNFNTLTELKTSTHKLLDAITVAFTESGAKSPIVTLSLEEYMNKCELKDRKEARKQAKADLETLFNARISFKEKRKNSQDLDYIDIRLCEAVGIRNGIINFNISNTFYNILLGYPIMPYPPQLWKLSARYNPNSYYLLRKISEHKNMNIGKKNEDVISVKTLLEATPVLPGYNEVMESDRRISSRIIEPFERDMNALENTLIWQYCHRNNVPLTDEELAVFDYTVFESLLVKVTWKVYPERVN
jgi:hypothetical protein